ncbi:CBS domain-containing protein [Acidobacteria bacterium AH-259-D05]|nr:CBS domain-containing protein [Acidobacteria bacterium AH-259-D05]
MDEVIYEMSRKGLGITSVVENEDRLVGVISDGDLRRLLQREREEVLSRPAGQCMTKDPLTISQDELATGALNLMEQKKITSLMVTDASQRIVGVIHLHDLWGTEMF